MMDSETGTFGATYAREQIRRARHPLRRLIKGFYLDNILRRVRGPTIDFGCGAGQLLIRLAPGSIGIELNPHLIMELGAQGLPVYPAQGDLTDFDLAGIPSGPYQCLVIAHVLEHLADPAAALTRLLAACRRLSIQRVIMVVPGAKGYRSDPTHQTFIDAGWLRAHPLPADCEFIAKAPEYFPGPRWLGRYFVFHEMLVVFECGADGSNRPGAVHRAPRQRR